MKNFLKKLCSKIYLIGKSNVESQRYLQIGHLGTNSIIGPECDLQPPQNILIGNNSNIGKKAVLWSTNAKIKIGNYVIFGPNVTLITGNHQTNIIGKRIAEVDDALKDTGYDEDIIIEDDVWIGANSTILKGVTIKEGCVIAAGSIVTKSTECAYGIYAGVPAKLIKMRFSPEELIEHKKLIK